MLCIHPELEEIGFRYNSTSQGYIDFYGKKIESYTYLLLVNPKNGRVTLTRQKHNKPELEDYQTIGDSWLNNSSLEREVPTVNEVLLQGAYTLMDSMYNIHPGYYPQVPIENFHPLYQWIEGIREELEKGGFEAQAYGSFLNFDDQQLEITLIVKSDTEIEGTIHTLDGTDISYSCTQSLSKGPFLPALLNGLNHQLAS